MKDVSIDNNYITFRGRCRELSEAACARDPSLTLVRGYYFCPIWNVEEQHWWTTHPNGEIYDPSRLQYPSEGNGIYTQFNGMVACAECHREIPEENASFESKYAFCSYQCHGRFIGVL